MSEMIKKEKSNRIIIIGRSASGKTYLFNEIVEKGHNGCIKHTTRPKREGEIEGKDYYYINNETFLNKVYNEEFITYESFNVDGKLWYYGISKEEYNDCNVVILTPSELKLLEYKKKIDDSIIIFLDIAENIRRDRLLLRNDSDSVERRIEADKRDFAVSINHDIIIMDPDFTLDDIPLIML